MKRNYACAIRWQKIGVMLTATLWVYLCASCTPESTAMQTTSPAGEVVSVTTAGLPPEGLAPESLEPGRALLVEGSRQVAGLPGLSQNAFPALTGTYAYRPVSSVQPGSPEAASPDTKTIMLRLWFTRQALLYPESWVPPAPSCVGVPGASSILAAPAEPDGSYLWVVRASIYSLFIRFPGDMPDPCRFVSVLVERFAFFFRYAESPGDVSFPAVLEIGR